MDAATVQPSQVSFPVDIRIPLLIDPIEHVASLERQVDLYRRMLKFKGDHIQRMQAQASTQDVLIGSYRDLYQQYRGSYQASEKELMRYIECAQECRCGGQLHSRRLVMAPHAVVQRA